MLNCQFHALNKAFESVCIKSLGKQGIRIVNIFQDIFVYAKMIKTMREEGGLKLIDTVHNIVMEKLLQFPIWQDEAATTSCTSALLFTQIINSGQKIMFR